MNRPNAPLVPTAWQTIGPFFPQTFFREGDNDLTRVSGEAAPTARGERIVIRGRVMEQGGGACANAVLEAWQADAGGRFRHPADPDWKQADPDFLGWGRSWTDADGHYLFHTIIPGGYRDAGGPRAPHVNYGITASGIMRRLTTTLFFPDFAEANAADPVLCAVPADLRHLLIATPDGEVDGVRAFRFDILLHGDAATETPFFQD